MSFKVWKMKITEGKEKKKIFLFFINMGFVKTKILPENTTNYSTFPDIK